MANYDMSIHMNPDARAWAKFFMESHPNSGLDENMMIGWFANAMMAMHDHLTGQSPPPSALWGSQNDARG